MLSQLIFPTELRGSKRPMMELNCFAPNDGGTFVVYVPIPSNVSFDDAASYNDTDLGIIGGLAMAAARNVSGNLSGSVLREALGTGARAYNKATEAGMGKDTTKGLIGAALKASGVGGEGVSSGVSIGMGATLNKNVTTEFSGVGTRAFTFAFKFIAKDKQESQIIADIVKGFRANLYPIGNFISLKYPPTWRIRFIDGVEGKDIKYLPKIFECYLTALSSNFNASVNIWHNDGSPIETDITVAFKESRALTYEDIKRLGEKAYEKEDFLSQYQKINSDGSIETLTSPAVGGASETIEAPTNTETQPPPSRTSKGYATGRIPGFPS